MFIDVYELKPFPGSSRSSMDSPNTPILPTTDPLLVPLQVYEAPRINSATAIGVLVCATVFTYLTADNLVSSLNGMVEHSEVSKEWVTLIIIPIISNAAEHTTAAIVASKGKFDLGMSLPLCSPSRIMLNVSRSYVCCCRQLHTNCLVRYPNTYPHCMGSRQAVDVAI